MFYDGASTAAAWHTDMPAHTFESAAADAPCWATGCMHASLEARAGAGVAGASPRSVKGVSTALSIEMASHRGSLHTHGSGASTPLSPTVQ